MSNNLFAHTSAVRVKVKKCELNKSTEWRKFSVDPQITSWEVLYSLLAKAFDIKSDFSIKYKAFDPAGNEIYLAVLSDWDLDAAFLRIHNLSIQTATEPCLLLQIDVKPFTDVKEWDAAVAVGTPGSVVTPTLANNGARELISPLQQSFGVSQKYVQHMQTKLPGLIINQMEKTFSIVQKAFNLSEETMASLPPRAPLSDSEFRLFLDALGQIQRSDELRKVIFLGGIDSSLRRVVWKHILNVYPSVMNGRQRMEYMRRKSEQYYRLRDTWKTAVKRGCIAGEISYVTGMVKKDVLRTDRMNAFYAGSDDNKNIAALFNILTTYALNHPSVSYCQGMSDIASPLLFVMSDEPHAYICFCAIMSRVRGNFMMDGIAMTQKFAHLTEALRFYDPEFWEYLKAQQADDLLFCYRWLLLELKREFPFEDALRMLEVQWSALKYDTVLCRELSLYEKEYVFVLESSTSTASSSLSNSSSLTPAISRTNLLEKPRENAYTKVCALRRQSSTASMCSVGSSASKLDATKRLNQSLDDNITRHAGRRQVFAKAHQSLDETKMLLLKEALEHATQPEKDANKTTVMDDGDDDVFISVNDAVKETETDQYGFLPTNPFKVDVQMIALDEATSTINDNLMNSALQLNNQEQLKKPSIQVSGGGDEAIPKGIAKLKHKNILSNYDAVSSIIAKQLAHASNVGESVKRVGSTSGGHFKDLKEKLAATSRRGMTQIDNSSNNIGNELSQQKLVKNFNEFLNFASMNKSRIANAKTMPATQLCTEKHKATKPSQITSPTHMVVSKPPPLVQLTKTECVSSFDDSDSSSVPDTSWSGSTAPTAIQEIHNLSSNSLQMELNPLSQPDTPARTPTPLERKPAKKEKEPAATTKGGKNNLTSPDDEIIAADPEYYPMMTPLTHELRWELENLDRQVYGEPFQYGFGTEISYEKLSKDSLDFVEDLKENEIVVLPDETSEISPLDGNLNLNVLATTIKLPQKPTVLTTSLDGMNLNPFLDENLYNVNDTFAQQQTMPHSSSLPPEVLVPLSTDTQHYSTDAQTQIEMATNACDEIAFAKSTQNQISFNGTPNSSVNILPPPAEFGGGNPFLMFLCLTLLLQHRNTIMKAGMDYNEIAMHFDKMVRKHDVTRVLNQARRMYVDYLKTQNSQQQRMQVPQTSSQIGDINKNQSDHIKNNGNAGISTFKS